MADAETLLFVDDDQAELGQLHVGRENAVRADKHVDLAFSCGFDDGFLFFVLRNRDNRSIFAGKAANRFLNVSKC